MSCSCTTASGGTVVKGSGPIGVSGSGTPTDPFIITENTGSALALEVRDSATVNMTLFGSGTKADPYVLRGDTSSAAALLGLSDVAASPAVQQGAVPTWVGAANAGQFQFRLPGTRYTTNATRGTGLYQGEVIRETDTGLRYEWDGTQWVSLTPTPAQQFVLDPTVVLAAGGIGSGGPDLNTLTVRSGIYRVAGTPSNINMPPGAYTYGTLVVFANGLSVTQRYSEHLTAGGSGGGGEYVRTKWNDSDWSAWARLAKSSEVDAVSTRVAALESGPLVRLTGLPGTVTECAPSYVMRTGRLVTLNFSLFTGPNGANSSSSNLMAALPAGYRPYGTHDFLCSGNAGGSEYTFNMAVDTDGGLRIRGGSMPNGGIWGTCTFIAA